MSADGAFTTNPLFNLAVAMRLTNYPIPQDMGAALVSEGIRYPDVVGAARTLELSGRADAWIDAVIESAGYNSRHGLEEAVDEAAGTILEPFFVAVIVFALQGLRPIRS